ncbi:MAG: selenium metabolism-associated LysR family transcriptional regulator [Desulfatiglans sp.]|nr:selenium metabolism-associated LysR family transcriptional regulator [Thermodesulfobacteriota bacterium]MEE4351939.1 selenium metabolism-associated LysR family transcriptional regulator [Desulfatiglans sp.]
MTKAIPRHSPSIDFGLRQLEVFRKVVDLKSFTKAADALFLAQASVSERIATLENQVGTRLLDRLGRKVVPTKAGELLYKHALLLLDMKNTAQLEIQEFLGLRKGDIHIGGSTIPGEYILPKVIGQFHKRNPLLKVTLTIADTTEIERLVMEGSLELGVTGSKGDQKTLVYRKLWRDELVLAVPIDHRWAGKKEVTLDELSDEPFIVRETGSGTLRILEKYLKAAGSDNLSALQTVARFGTSTSIKEGIKAGLGVSILSSRALDTELRTGVLTALKVRGLSMSRHFYLIRDKRRIASPPCKEIMSFLTATSEG